MKFLELIKWARGFLRRVTRAKLYGAFFLGFLAVFSFSGCSQVASKEQTVVPLSAGSPVSGSQQVLTQENKGTPGAQGTKIPGKIPLTVTLSNGTVRNFNVELARTEAERERGLMYRTTLPENEGMLFLFEKPMFLSFWMKNTLIPLDMIFLGSDFKVVKIFKNVQPCKADPCSTYTPNSQTQYVLEINGGLSDRLGILEGDSLFWAH